MLPGLPSNEKNSSNYHNSYNKGPNLALFSFTESPSNSLPTIKFPKNYITSSYHMNLPKTTNAILVHQRALGVKERACPMLNYAPPCFQKFLQSTPCFPMLSSHAPPCLFLGNTVDIKEIRNTIASNASIYGAKTRDRKIAKISI
jgi:hypothetical protein